MTGVQTCALPICVSNACARICGISTLEAYCDASSPCDSTKGYTCTKSRCRPPTGATRVQVGETCDQGGANTLFWCAPSDLWATRPPANLQLAQYPRKGSLRQRDLPVLHPALLSALRS